jgi:Kdo2-lipid IVA lauroyltransferase/acyltransferase
MAKIKTRRYYIYYLIKAGLFVVGLIPLKAALAAAAFFGRLGFRYLKKYRETAIANLDRVFSDDHEGNVRIAERVFVNFAKNGVEWAKLLSMGPADVKKMLSGVYGQEHLDEVLCHGKGAIVMGFHFGNWEMLGIGLRTLGYPGALVARRIYFDKYDKIITRMRARFDARVIYRDESPKKMLLELKKGNILGIVPDQDVDSIEGVFVDFFGEPAYTPTAPVKMASVAGTAIVPIFIIRNADDTHKMVIERPIRVPEKLKEESEIKRYTQEWTDILEKHVRGNPDHWVWIHKRWKTRSREAAKKAVKMKAL